MEKLTISVKEMAELLGLSLPSAYELTRRDGFPVIHAGAGGRKKLIVVESLKEWLKQSA